MKSTKQQFEEEYFNYYTEHARKYTTTELLKRVISANNAHKYLFPTNRGPSEFQVKHRALNNELARRDPLDVLAAQIELEKETRNK